MENIPSRNYEADASHIVIDLEVDLEGFGGIQRFRTLGDVEGWLNEEKQFWAFLEASPGKGHANNFNLNTTFFALAAELDQAIQEFRGSIWQPKANQITIDERAIVGQAATDNQIEEAKQRLQNLKQKLEAHISSLKSRIAQILKDRIVRERSHLSRFEPLGQFVVNFASNDPVGATYALDQILLMEQKNGERRSNEFVGRMEAVRRHLGWESFPASDTDAFSEAIKTWGQELAHFKRRYEDLEKNYQSLRDEMEAERAGLVEYITTTRTLFSELDENQKRAAEAALEAAAKDLKALTDTYDEHMALKAPAAYWSGKYKLHAKKTNSMKWWVVFASVAAAVAIGCSAYMVLPEHHPSGEIPWRRLGIFLLVSTFGLSFVRLTIKLMLSNLHLAADAEERTIMIRTFMALLRRSSASEGLKKEDIAIVLAPIFKPSTSGIIRDDGGPTSLGEFLSHMSGGKS